MCRLSVADPATLNYTATTATLVIPGANAITHSWRDKVVLITGGSAGLGEALAEAFAAADARLVLAARNREQLDQVVARLAEQGTDVLGVPTDVTNQDEVEALLAATLERHNRIDVLVNNVGRSGRGDVLDTPLEQFQELWESNVLTTIRCTTAAAAALRESRGQVINIGSLAGKTVSRYLAGYPASKFAVAGYTHQLRLELEPHGVGVLLVCPGPIAREDAGERYAEQASHLPREASQPGGGVRLKGIPPNVLAEKILRAAAARRAELIVPGYTRWLLALQQFAPRWGDWVVRRFSGS